MQAVLRWPGFGQWKQSFFSTQHLCSSGVSLETLMVSMTIVSGLWIFAFEELEKEW